MLARCLAAPLAALLLAAGPTAQAGYIIDPAATFFVDIDRFGNLGSDTTFFAFRRAFDGFDPFYDNPMREVWGVSAGPVNGYADKYLSYGSKNLVAVSARYGVYSATTVSELDPGSGPLVRVTQRFSMPLPNVLQIDTTLANVSGADQAVRYSRNADWDLSGAAGPVGDTTYIDPAAGPVVDSTYFGFEDPDPLKPYAASGHPAGGVFRFGDYGGGMVLDFGTLAAGASVRFRFFYAVSGIPGQSPFDLRNQLEGLGAYFTIAGSGNGTLESAAMGVGPAAAPAAVPEPASVGLLAVGGLLVAARRARRRWPA